MVERRDVFKALLQVDNVTVGQRKQGVIKYAG